MLNIEDSLVLIIDVQEKLVSAVSENEIVSKVSKSEASIPRSAVAVYSTSSRRTLCMAVLKQIVSSGLNCRTISPSDRRRQNRFDFACR